MEIKTFKSISGFIASDPKITFNEQGQACFYARIGINHYRREQDGSWTELEPSFHDLLQFGRGAELSAQRFRKGDNLLAQGYVRNHLQTADGRERTEQQFVAKRLAHDPNITTYHVERRGRGSERETPSPSHEAAVRETTPTGATAAAIGAGPNGLGY